MMEKIYYNGPGKLFVKALLENNDIAFNDILNVTISELAKEIPDYSEIREILEFRGGSEKNIDKGVQIQKLYDGSPYFGCEKHIFWDFRDNFKTEEQRILLLSYLALKSIIGKERKFAHLTNEYWLSRMSGYGGLAPEKEIPDKTEEAEREIRRKVKGGKYDFVKETYTKVLTKKRIKIYHPIVQKYSSHYHLQRIKALLYEYYHVSFYSKTRGFFVSCEWDLATLTKKILSLRERKKVSLLKSETMRIEEEYRQNALGDERKIR